MAANDEGLWSAYNPEESLVSLIERLNKCSNYAVESGNPVTETQLVYIAYILVAEKGYTSSIGGGGGAMPPRRGKNYKSTSWRPIWTSGTSTR